MAVVAGTVALATVAALLGLPSPHAFGAATIVVTSTGDVVDGAPPCTLREAVQSANTDTGVGGCTPGDGVDRLELPAGTFSLALAGVGEDAAATGDLDLTEAADVVGSGRDATFIDGNADVVGDRVFEVLGGPVTFSDLEITDGFSSTGGAISASADFNLTRVDLITNNSDFLGGALFTNGVTGEISDSALTGNRTEGTAIPAGGAIHNTNASELTIRGSTLSENVVEDTDDGLGADGTGGAISNFNGSTLVIEDSVISGNATDADGLGGGIFNTNSSTLTVERTTISGNSAEQGGALHNTNSAGATVVNSTVSGNDANDSGGGIRAASGSLSVLSSTLTGNRADLDADGDGDGGGIFAAATAFDVDSSVIAGNMDVGPGAPQHDCSGALDSVSYSLVGDTSCTFAAAVANLDPATEPGLGPLAANGGLGRTHALLAGSPLIDAGSPDPLGSASGCPTTDQRSLPRADCDIGAFEVQPVIVDTTVEGRVFAKKKQKQERKRIVVKVKVKAKEDLDAKAKGKIKLGRKSYRLRPESKSVSEGKKKRLKLKPKKRRHAKKIAQALRKGKKAKAKLRVKLTDEAGNTKTEKLKVTLKR